MTLSHLEWRCLQMFKMQDIAALAFANMRHEDHNEE